MIKDEAVRSIVWEIWHQAKGGGIRRVQSILRSYGLNVVVDGWLGNKSLNAINREGDRFYFDVVELLKELMQLHKTTKLTRELIEKTAYDLGVSGGAVYAIARTESNGSFVWQNGKIPILFERHICYRQLRDKHGLNYAKKMYRKYPTLCNPKAGGYGGSRIQYAKLSTVIRLWGKEIAYISASHGCFQLMGFNFGTCGYSSAIEMVEDMRANPVEGQLRAFSNFVRNYHHGKLLKSLKAKNFDDVARRYNGKAYKRNKYAEKMRRYSNMYDVGDVL